MYQAMDAGFVGLIFSCFARSRVQLVAFQAVERKPAAGSGLQDVVQVGLEEINVPVVVVHAPAMKVDAVSQVVAMQTLFREEERQAYLDAASTARSGLVRVHSAGVYEKGLCRLLEFGSLPLLEVLRLRVAQNKAILAALRK
jgi:hypothetical protein